MRYKENVPLSTLTTMRLGGVARYVVEILSKDDLVAAIEFARERDRPWFVLGGGSNVVAKGDFDGLIILNRIKGFDKLEEDEASVTYKIGAGEVWDSIVERLVAADLSGVEAMSAIPGYAGSTPIQNVGAYGQEIADTLVELEAYDTSNDKFVKLDAEACKFSYRNSIFKNPDTRHHIITSITLKLSKEPPRPPFYPSLEKYLASRHSELVSESTSNSDQILGAAFGTNHQVQDDNFTFSPSEIRAAVMAIRAEKLPDPRDVASAGSFFKNPIVSRAVAEKLLSRFPEMPHWSMSENQEKLAAGWLIDQAGLKSYSSHGLQIYPKNALVVTNLTARSADDLKQFKSEIIARVKQKFGVTLEQEPENLT
ncbi:UDP-N-acetylmuramate dehydrogenase [Candidatus Saccharibacteria bacterium]|nr:UDP-N-acetylmuramate dehydrogenase [Candidatus Saccharibacteria bacterium]